MKQKEIISKNINENAAANAYPIAGGDYFAPDVVVHNAARAHSILMYHESDDTVYIPLSDLARLWGLANKMTSVYLFVSFARREGMLVQTLELENPTDFTNGLIDNIPNCFNPRVNDVHLVLDKPSLDNWGSTRETNDYEVIMKKLNL